MILKKKNITDTNNYIIIPSSNGALAPNLLGSKFSIQLYIVTYIETFFFDGHNTQLIYVSDRQKTGMRCEVPHVSLNSSHACIRTTSYQFSVFISNALQTQNRSR